MGSVKGASNLDESAQPYDLHDTLSHLLRRSHFHAEGLFSTHLGHFGITSRQLALLVAVSQNPGSSQRKVGEMIALDTNTVSDLLRRMERNKLVERVASPEDGRSRQIGLTNQGAEVLRSIHAENDAYQEQLTDRLTTVEAEQLKSLLRKMLNLKG